MVRVFNGLAILQTYLQVRYQEGLQRYHTQQRKDCPHKNHSQWTIALAMNPACWTDSTNPSPANYEKNLNYALVENLKRILKDL